MTVLQPEEYDISYFDGSQTTYQHNAGYSKYARWYRKSGENSLGEYWKDYAQRWVSHLAISGKKVLEIGCAKGFIVEELNDMGVDAYGLDVSSYALTEAEDSATARRPDLSEKFILGDARTSLSQFSRNEFDVILSLRFIECIPETEIPALIDEMNRISKLQVHVIDQFTGNKEGAGQYYINKPIQFWLDDFDWARGTKIIAQEDTNTVLTK